MNGPIFRFPSFGGCKLSESSTKASELTSPRRTLSIGIRFEEALKLHLALSEGLVQLNRNGCDVPGELPQYLHLSLDLEGRQIRVHAGDAPATKASFKTVPMPSKKSKLPMRRRFTADQLVLIAKGHVPESMDDKWFIYLDPLTSELFMHRSWTGYCIYIVQLKKRQDDWAVNIAWVNRDPGQYEQTNLTHDLSVANWLIDVFLLGQHRDFPSETDQNDSAEKSSDGG